MKLGIAKGVADSKILINIVNETNPTLNESMQSLDKSIIQDVALLPEQITIPVSNQVETITAPQESSVAIAIIIIKPLSPYLGGPSFDI